MNLNEKDNHDSMIFSIGRNGASVYNNFQDDMPCDYDLKDEKCFDECYDMIESIKDDDKVCIEKLLNSKAEKKAARKNKTTVILYHKSQAVQASTMNIIKIAGI